eukprot:CAMPEP_0114353976 /NCGR_PEP_ID=MMETSP0101-20121206/19078_1 /TAXON_ID=38822 ORGANISM="Pteridomonas danica, Strain PT" /NCGR_SAMPLE_ID=MMETSP0101 /ASSEMBLY_ACC=CAM_ASM_000211 /LENGTH=43 /DNA_ID= /DNA_START= /DNA_END= /DNA_ORIENTATION=
MDGEQLRFRKADGADYVAIKPEDAEITTLLIDGNIPLKVIPQE